MRKKYKELYLEEKCKRETLEERFNAMIEQLKHFNLIKVIDKTEYGVFGCFNTRKIIIEQDKDHYIHMIINDVFNDKE